MVIQSLLKFVKQITAVVWPSGCFRMILYAKGLNNLVSNAGDRIVVQISMCDLKAVGQGFFLDREPMVLRSYLDSTRFAIQNRLVGTAVTELHFESLCTAGQREQLVAQADAKNGEFSEKVLDGRDGVRQRLRVSRPVAQKDAVGFLSKNIAGSSGPRKNCDAIPALSEMPWDIPLHAIIEANHVRLPLICHRPSVDGRFVQC
jgi:hypothetical protein